LLESLVMMTEQHDLATNLFTCGDGKVKKHADKGRRSRYPSTTPASEIRSSYTQDPEKTVYLQVTVVLGRSRWYNSLAGTGRISHSATAYAYEYNV